MSRHCKSCKKEIHREIKNGNYYCDLNCQKNYKQKLYAGIEPSENIKTCPGCNEDKPGNEYYIDRSSPDGRTYHCMKCYQERSFRKGKGSDPRLSVRMRIGYDKYLGILKRDNYCCQICGGKVTAIYSPDSPPGLDEHYEETALELDHIIPECKGGLTIVSNLQVTHRKCNREKGRTIPDKLNDIETNHVQNRVVENEVINEGDSPPVAA